VVAIVGGGYTGTITAILLSRMASGPLDIRIIEPRADLGRGVAYDTDDPAHRLNVPPGLMVLYLDDIEHFSRYVAAQGIAAADPDAVAADGSLYVRRQVFGDYMVAEVRAHMAENPSNSTISHLRDHAASLAAAGGRFRLATARGNEVIADAVVLCTSHGRPSLPPGFPESLAGHDGLIVDPWSEAEITRIGQADRLLIVGAGLTGADVVTSLHRRGHAGDIVMLSRHGLPPNRQHDFGDVGALLERVRRPIPDFIERHGEFASVRQVVRAVRRDIEAARRADPDFDWRQAFDHVRDAGGMIWRNLPKAEKRRYARHLSSYYGSHRNRVAPQVVDDLDTLARAGRLSMLAGRILAAEADGTRISVSYRERHGGQVHRRTFDAVVNCTGPMHRPDGMGSSFLADAVKEGLIHPDAFGFGIDVDGRGRAARRLYVAGPLARGYFGDVIGVPQITAQLHTILPALLGDLIAA
jgi:uncharacterized NAD(P)/FAD-binding protein YdhS